MNPGQEERFYGIADKYQMAAREFGYSLADHHSFSGTDANCKELGEYILVIYILDRNDFTFSMVKIGDYTHEIQIRNFGSPNIITPLSLSSDEIDNMLTLAMDFFDHFVKNHDDLMLGELRQQRISKIDSLKREIELLEQQQPAPIKL